MFKTGHVIALIIALAIGLLAGRFQIWPCPDCEGASTDGVTFCTEGELAKPILEEVVVDGLTQIKVTGYECIIQAAGCGIGTKATTRDVNGQSVAVCESIRPTTMCDDDDYEHDGRGGTVDRDGGSQPDGSNYQLERLCKLTKRVTS